MNELDATELAKIGGYLLSDKLFMTSVHFLWVYDYFLTLGDEVKHAWSGWKSRLFALFVAIRYSPLLYLIWVNAAMFYYSDSLYAATKWMTIFHTAVVTILSQVAVGLRLYAVTERNKLLAGVILAIITAQVSFGTYYFARTVLGPAKPLLGIDLDAYEVCFSGEWGVGGFIFTGIAITFDVLAFLVIVVTARRPRLRYPGIPSILDTILRDATMYFILLFICQVCLLIFLVFAPNAWGTMFIVCMGTGADKVYAWDSKYNRGMWTLETMSALGESVLRDAHTIRFASVKLAVSSQTLETLGGSIPEEVDIELKPMPVPSQNSGS